jgi:molybdopterin-containing oxidoreductase family iron-sulfur binding subunit
LQAARAKAAAEGRRELQEGEYVPACVEACPNGAITFGDLADENSAVAQLARDKNTFRFLVRLGTEPKVYYHSTQPWVRQLAETKLARMKKETVNG